MNSTNLIIKLAGNETQPPPNWMDIGVLASFGDEVQASITTQEFRFILDSYQAIKDHIAGGLLSGPGIFEPIPFTIEATSLLGNVVAFDGGINAAEADINDTKEYIEAPLSKDMGLNTLDQRLSGLTYGLIKHNGTITPTHYVDVPYVVDKPDRALEAAVLAITFYLMTKQLIDTVKEIAVQVATIPSIAASGISGAVGAAIFAAAVALINIAYAVALLVLLIDLGKDLIAAFVQPIRTHKAMMVKTLLEKACEHLGYGFNTTIDDLEYLVYLPSNPHLDVQGLKGFIQSPGVITSGIPHPSDYGYKADEMFRLAKDLFHARYHLINGVVELHAENAPYWKRLSPWQFPDVLEDASGNSTQTYRLNTDELNDSVLLSFATDITDQWTIENFKGTNYQVITSAVTAGPSGRDHITGLDEVAFPVALGNRKEELNGFEKFVLVLAAILDDVTGTFGGNTSFVSQVQNKLGVLRVGSNNHSVPKLLWMDGGKIPSNHRDLFSAKTLWNKYHVYKSFIHDNFKRQRKVFEGVEIPFGMADFLQLIDNSYFVTDQGKEGKVTKIEWNMAKDKAIISYWMPEVYTKNLQETFVEPE